MRLDFIIGVIAIGDELDHACMFQSPHQGKEET